MNERIMEAFRELGFQLEQVEELGYRFSYEGNNYVWLANESDENFFCISLPCIYDMEEDNIARFMALSEKLNSTPKYVKAYRLGDSLWLFYERELMGEEDMKSLISRMVLQLEAALLLAHDYIATLENVSDGGNAEDNEADEMTETEESED